MSEKTSPIYVDQLEGILKQRHADLAELAKDETGAKREHIFHKDLAGIVNNRIEFSNSGAKLRPNIPNTSIVTVTAYDLNSINVEDGKVLGDTYLKKTVVQTRNSLGKCSNAFEIFHRGNQDFTCIVSCKNIAQVTENLQKHPISVGNRNFRVSVTYIELAEIAKTYNEFTTSYETMQNDRIRLKIFIELLLKLSEYRREYKKIQDLARDYIAPKTIYTKNSIDYFNKFVASIFVGSQFSDISGFEIHTKDPATYLKKVAQFNAVCNEIAARNVFTETRNYQSHWNVILGKYSQGLTSKHLQYNATIGTEEKHANINYVRFKQEHQTPTKKRIDITKNTLDILEDDIKDALIQVDKLTSISHKKDTQLLRMELDDFYTNLVALNDNHYSPLKELEKIKRSIKNVIANSQDIKSKKQMLEIFETLTEVKLQIEILRTDLNIELCSIDPMTGLKNKTDFEHRLKNIYKETTDKYQIIAIDLGFLKYFNKEGDRELGDTAIRTAGYILNATVENFANAEVYRTGGDEFAILCNGGEPEVKKIIQAINNLTQKVGPIPSKGKELGKYFPEVIQFNVGYCLFDEAIGAVAKLMQPELGALSREDIKRLDSKSKSFDKSFFAEITSRMQFMIADLEIENQKLYSRVAFLVNLYNSGKVQQFRTIYPYSGKVLEGLDINNCEQIIKQNKEEDIEAIVQKIRSTRNNRYITGRNDSTTLDKVVHEFAQSRVIA